ncbi:MAG TPA: L-glutamate gamma-semialdehyde dehydrogenase [Candidatus Cloacimonadota bacterium]|jgi:1-pyrroline-5-carboxylate dehydrogenase|nr:L-glutamate gamma-semialdehyde dehydrogenase [Candidatus Cloacimonadota bacterium]HOC95933.1 L-glutamate gamma-semialdehyde dehydrogenase [Candidatus Cloacimonadota bacterium]HOG30711.1 L-glutamate gamma-semialdehyde dehydrogenase [Candidatus Cloacimonadota bacterium]HOR59061.1 L-glutamate gamma-semialdehyde dehydrogenase [Candidatus Cloacimonadota bacterium]HPB08639.1 L-glutamate gamma-semialdehyde dehydrogenase [Candidatus Cloacimonadota bacterium]
MFFTVATPENEPIKSYAPGTKERDALKAKLDELGSQFIEIPAIIGGKEVFSGNTADCIEPHNHMHVIGKYYKCGEKEIDLAIQAAVKASRDWEQMSFYHRSAIFLRAAELLSTKYRYLLNAATMLGQSKNAFQAEIDSACELIDFWRFNPYYAQKIYEQQPLISPKGEWNFSEYRALEGFVFAITPFNFTSIAGNLPTAPALMGNTVVWKPSGTAVYSGYFIMKILMEAGLPAGVINFVPGSGAQMGDLITDSPYLAGIHFTGSTQVFNHIWKRTANNIHLYKSYPRIVGETGGKDFIFAHASADIKTLAVASLRGAFEFQGQKCSAASRLYIPDSLYGKWFEEISAMLATVKMGEVQDFSNFVNAVIDKSSFTKIKEYIDKARNASDAEIVWGGKCDDSKGYFIEPTIIKTTNPKFVTMQEEIFGPVLTVYAYPEKEFTETLDLCDKTSPYGLTGSIFAQDRTAISVASELLKHSAGNFYINDKPTGAVVGQQPFGGARSSGTNDKAGSAINLYRWVSARSIKETFVPADDYRYPFMG